MAYLLPEDAVPTRSGNATVDRPTLRVYEHAEGPGEPVVNQHAGALNYVLWEEPGQTYCARRNSLQPE
jgi:hypothetical protein